MSDLELIDAVAQKTGEDSHEIRRRGFVLTGPEDSGLETECLLDVMLVESERVLDKFCETSASSPPCGSVVGDCMPRQPPIA